MEESLLYILFSEELKSPSAEVDAIGFIPSEFWADEDQPENLEGDVLDEEAEWTALAEVEAAVKSAKMMVFGKPSERMTKHLKPLYIKAFYKRENYQPSHCRWRSRIECYSYNGHEEVRKKEGRAGTHKHEND